MLKIFVLVLGCVSGALSAQTYTAQRGPQAEPPGRVVGHVYASDTNGPVRFAQVHLEPMPTLHPSALAKPAEATRPASDAVQRTVTHAYATSLDGSFTIPNVAPGRYFVIVQQTGYVNSRRIFTDDMLHDPSPDMQKLIAAALPEVTVDSSEATTVQVRLQRGASISGRILYDDGSPAATLSVKLLQPDPEHPEKWVDVYRKDANDMISYHPADDTGRYHFAALLPGKYLLECEMSLEDSTTTTTGNGSNQFYMTRNDSRSSLNFYGAGTAFESKAKPIEIQGSEQLEGIDMTLPIGTLVRVTGHVAAGADAHFVSGAKVELVTRDDHAVIASSGISREDGLFHFEFVPPGEYTIQAKRARDVTWVPGKHDPNFPQDMFAPEEEKVLKVYGDTEQPITINGEQQGITIVVPPDAKPSKDDDTPK
jgi:hypothetical protein